MRAARAAVAPRLSPGCGRARPPRPTSTRPPPSRRARSRGGRGHRPAADRLDRHVGDVHLEAVAAGHPHRRPGAQARNRCRQVDREQRPHAPRPAHHTKIMLGNRSERRPAIAGPAAARQRQVECAGVGRRDGGHPVRAVGERAPLPIPGRHVRTVVETAPPLRVLLAVPAITAAQARSRRQRPAARP